MASDDAYAAFLDKANRDPSSASTAANPPSSSPSTKTPISALHAQGAPAVLRTAAEGAFYTSDSDEPFEPFAIPVSATELPDEETFLKWTGSKASAEDVSILDPYDWDTNGQYKALLDAVTASSEGNDVRVYRVALPGGTRVEYWLVTVKQAAATQGATGQFLGVKALAIES